MQITEELIQELKRQCPYAFDESELAAIKEGIAEEHNKFGIYEEHYYPSIYDMLVDIERLKNLRYKILPEKFIPSCGLGGRVVYQLPPALAEKALEDKQSKAEAEYRSHIDSLQSDWVQEQIQILLAEQTLAEEEALKTEQAQKASAMKQLLLNCLNS